MDQIDFVDSSSYDGLVRERSNTWPCNGHNQPLQQCHHQHQQQPQQPHPPSGQSHNLTDGKPAFVDCYGGYHHSQGNEGYAPFLAYGALSYGTPCPCSTVPQPSQCSPHLGHINESNESLKSCDSSTTASKDESSKVWAFSRQKSTGSTMNVATLTGGRSNSFSASTSSPAVSSVAPGGAVSSSSSVAPHRVGHPSYVELITQAILLSPGQRLTLAEIYDWMVNNVEAFKNQRHLHSSTGWKNSVRHNLSLHSRFKRVKRNGMDKPSWWTVDLNEESKRYRGGTTSSSRSSRGVKSTGGAGISQPSVSCAANHARTSSTIGGSSAHKAEGGRSARIENISVLTMPLSSMDSTPNKTCPQGDCHGRVARRSVISSSSHFSPYGGAQPFADLGTATTVRELLMSSAVNEAQGLTFEPYVESEHSNSCHLMSSGDASNVADAIAGVAPATTTSSLPSSLSSAMTVDLAPPSYVQCWPQASADHRRFDAGCREASLLFSHPEVFSADPLVVVSSDDFSQILGSTDSSTLNATVEGLALKPEQTLSVRTTCGGVKRVSVPTPLELKIVVQSEQQCQTDHRRVDSGAAVDGAGVFLTSTLSSPGDDQALHCCLKRRLFIDHELDNPSASNFRRHTFSSGTDGVNQCSAYINGDHDLPQWASYSQANIQEAQGCAANALINQPWSSDWLQAGREFAPEIYAENLHENR